MNQSSNGKLRAGGGGGGVKATSFEKLTLLSVRINDWFSQMEMVESLCECQVVVGGGGLS